MKRSKEKDELIKFVKKEKNKNYMILYTITASVWVLLVIFAFFKNYINGESFSLELIYSFIGILPPILLFDFFNEKLSKDASAIEMSNKITEALMSNPEMIELFTDKQKKTFIQSTIETIADGPDAAEMINSSMERFLFTDVARTLKTEFNYNFELRTDFPAVYDDILTDKTKYFYVQEILDYSVKYLSDDNILSSNIVKIAFRFDNNSLDNTLRDRENDTLFNNCVFREKMDLCAEDVENFKRAALDINTLQKLIKLNLRVDGISGNLENVTVKDDGILCTFKVGHDLSLKEHSIRIIFHMPKQWNSILDVVLIDPTKSPRISLSYPEDSMNVEMFAFLNKDEKTTLDYAHEHMNGIYDVIIDGEWIQPVSGVVFKIDKKST